MDYENREQLIQETLDLLLLISSEDALRCVPGHVLNELHSQLMQAAQWAKVICKSKRTDV